MNKFYTLVLGLTLGFTSFGQVLFQSDLSDWTSDLPDGFMGSKSSIAPANVVEQTIGVTYGTSLAQLINDSGDHKRFTTQEISVVGGEAYEIKMWITGLTGSELRTNFYDATNLEYGTYNDYIDVFAETGGALTMVSQTVVIPADCSEGEFILSLRNTGATGIVLDSIAITSTVPPVAEEVSIYDIQFATDAPYISPYEGELIKTRGVVTGVFLFGSNEKRFFIQDGAGAWNGIYVYENGTDLVIGDSVEVTGSVSEFFELTEIVSVSEINIISSGNPLPAPVEVTTAEASMEEYEGVLVKVISAECTNDDAGFGQFELNDGSGARLIDDEMYSYAAAAGNHYSVTGVTFLSFGDVKIFPRMMSDIEVTGFASIQENKSSFLMYPNPTDDFVYISTTNEETEVYFYSVSGKLVYKTIGSSQVNVNDFAPGVYQVVLKSNDSQSIEKLIVR